LSTNQLLIAIGTSLGYIPGIADTGSDRSLVGTRDIRNATGTHPVAVIIATEADTPISGLWALLAQPGLLKRHGLAEIRIPAISVYLGEHSRHAHPQNTE
jgi:hypothetical protein